MFNWNFVNFATTLEGSRTHEFEDCIWTNEKIDQIMSAFTVGFSKNNEAVGIDGVSVEVLKTSLRVISSILNLSLSYGWLPKCLRDA